MLFYTSGFYNQEFWLIKLYISTYIFLSFDLFKKDNITTVENNKYICEASTPIEEFDAKFDTKLNNRNYDTIGGFVIKKLNKLPKKGENLVYGDMRFTVKDTSNRKINRILVEIVKT